MPSDSPPPPPPSRFAMPRVLIVAGSDSGGGAGIQADIKTVTMLGGHAMTAVTAITAQNTLGVSAIHPVPADMVVAQMRACIDDLGVDAIKIGMIGSAETALAVAGVLEGLDVPVVLDPVMVATSGAVLADADTIQAIRRLMAVATVVTPNVPELGVLAGHEVESEGDALTAARGLVDAIGAAILAKGGHLPPDRSGPVVAPGEQRTTDLVADNLVLPDGSDMVWTGERIDTRHTHGTGCTLASAVAEGLGRGLPLPEAVGRAHRFVRVALREAPGFGGGHGPMGHARVRLDADVGGITPNHVTLPASDHAASVGFYRALGLWLIVDSGGRYARFESAGGATLSVEASREIDGRAVVYLEVGDLDAAVARARSAGIAVEGPVAEPWGWREARLVDPAGNPLRLYAAGEMRRFPPWRLACRD